MNLSPLSPPFNWAPLLGSALSWLSIVVASILLSQFSENLPPLLLDHYLYLIKFLILHSQHHITLAFFQQESH